MIPKVTVVLPTYNGEKYIQKSIESIIAQTFTDWELIVVNDCSTDNTVSIVTKYAKIDKRVKVVSNEANQKLPKSLNIGFEHSRGEYLTWTSDDNYYLPDALEKMVKYLDEYRDFPMVSAGMEFINEKNEISGDLSQFDADKMYYNNCVGACFMYRRTVLDDIGTYDTGMFLVEDYDYWMRVLLHYGQIGHINEILYRYRRHDNSLTATRMQDIKKQLMILRMKYLDFIIERLKMRKDYLCGIYYEFKLYEIKTETVDKKFYELVPELCMDKGLKELKKIIVYGAGDYGNKAYEKFGKRIIFYADGNKSKVGQEKNGIEIISVDEMISKLSEYQIMIAVSGEKIYQLLDVLLKKGVTECCV